MSESDTTAAQADESESNDNQNPATQKRRGRPKGSKNRSKEKPASGGRNSALRAWETRRKHAAEAGGGGNEDNDFPRYKVVSGMASDEFGLEDGGGLFDSARGDNYSYYGDGGDDGDGGERENNGGRNADDSDADGADNDSDSGFSALQKPPAANAFHGNAFGTPSNDDGGADDSDGFNAPEDNIGAGAAADAADDSSREASLSVLQNIGRLKQEAQILGDFARPVEASAQEEGEISEEWLRPLYASQVRSGEGSSANLVKNAAGNNPQQKRHQQQKPQKAQKGQHGRNAVRPAAQQQKQAQGGNGNGGDAQQQQAAIEAPRAPAGPSLESKDLHSMQVAELLDMAEKRGLAETLLSHRKDDIIFVLLRHHAASGEIVCRGAIDIRPEGYGALRNPSASFKTGRDDAMIPLQVIRKFGLRPGDFVRGPAHPPTKEQRDKRFTIYDVFSVNGATPSGVNRPQLFETATAAEPSEPAFAAEEIEAAADPAPALLLGQRVLFKGASKSAATTRAIALANRIGATRPKTEIICLLTAVKPEELAAARRGVNAKLYGTAFDDDPHQQVQSVKVSLDMARRKAEKGENVFIIMDSVTDLARACVYTQIADEGNLPEVAELNAIVRIKQMFAAGRSLENGGSITFVAGMPDTGCDALDERVRRELAISANAIWEPLAPATAPAQTARGTDSADGADNTPQS